MEIEDRAALADELATKLIERLSPELLTGTGQQFRERRAEMIRLAAKVMGAILYDELPASEQMFRTRALEAKILHKSQQSGHVWAASAANDDPPEA